MQNAFFIQLSEKEFKELLKNSVKELLESSNEIKKESQKEILSLRETADFLNIAPQTLYGYTSNRSIPFIKKGKKLYFKRSDILKWLNAGNKIQK
ncbi:helix-turn-helix domain-containing protein [Pollutibacter soli]|uniref:helix-turn-helix domain-containing protein n=1 Tax=Pollutibacter soli TaxID=3034157 RepID=UPI00301388E8